MNKARFLGVFLVSFALLLVFWTGTQASRWYVHGLLTGAGLVGAAVHGWTLQYDPVTQEPVWRRGNDQVRAALQFDALAIALVPALALLAATPGLRTRRRAALMALAALLCFAVDIVIVALFPLLVFYKNPCTDVLGTFLGLIAFVGAPVIIWFALTFAELQRALPGLQRPPRRTAT
jgi:hypothetical protein